MQRQNACVFCCQQVYEEQALELVGRNVAASSGDLRHAVRACCLAVDCLAKACKPSSSTPAPAAAPQQRSTVTARDMLAALGQLSSVKASNASAAAVAAIRSLPNQQQLLLYVVATLSKPSEPKEDQAGTLAAPTAGGQAASKKSRPTSKLYFGPTSAPLSFASGIPLPTLCEKYEKLCKQVRCRLCCEHMLCARSSSVSAIIKGLITLTAIIAT